MKTPIICKLNCVVDIWLSKIGMQFNCVKNSVIIKLKVKSMPHFAAFHPPTRGKGAVVLRCRIATRESYVCTGPIILVRLFLVLFFFKYIFLLIYKREQK